MLESAARLDQGQRMRFAARAQLEIIGERRAKVVEHAADGLFAQLRPAEQGEILAHRHLRLRMRQAIYFRQYATYGARALDPQEPCESNAGVEPKGAVKCPRVMRFQVSV